MSNFSVLEWIGVVVGVIGLLPLLLAVMSSSNLYRELRDGKLSPERRETLSKEAEDLHWTIGVVLLFYGAVFAFFQLSAAN